MHQPLPNQLLREYCRKRYGKGKLIRWLKWYAPRVIKGYLCKEVPFTKEPIICDVLVVQPNRGKGPTRNHKLINRLKSLGLHVEERFILQDHEVYSRGEICPPYTHGPLFRLQEGHANFLKKMYQPKVIITETLSLLSPFLKSRAPEDPVTFQLPHYALTASTLRNTFVDFDYFPLYGQSSLDYVKKMKVRFGACKILLGGSYLFDETFDIPTAKPDAPILMLGMGPNTEKRKAGNDIYQLVADWQKMSGRKLLIRLHPRSKGVFWSNLNQDGITVLPPEPFVESAARASLMLTNFTNAVIDAAILRRPCQLISPPGQVDYLQVERFFGPRAYSVKELDAAISNRFSNYEDSLAKCDEFAKYHIANGKDSVSSLAGYVKTLVDGETLKIECELSYDGKFSQH